ncbi:MAG: hypothetical protein ABH832_00245 [bacterium]
MSKPTELKHGLHDETKEQALRRLSETVRSSALEGRKEVFDRLTSRNAHKIAEMSKEKPVFYENDPTAEQSSSIDDEIVDSLPDDFFTNPTEWIESRPNINRGYDIFSRFENLPYGASIEELWEHPYDVSKVKIITLSNGKIITSKRINGQTSEVDRAKKAFQAGIPTPKVLGEIHDKGNYYVWYEYIPARNVDSFLCDKITSEFLLSSCPISTTNDKQFKEQMLETSVSIFLDDESSQQKLHDLWLKFKDHIIRINSGYHFLGDLSKFVLNWDNTKIGDFKDKMLSLFGDEDEVSAFFISLGYSSIDDFIDVLLRSKERGEHQEFSHEIMNKLERDPNREERVGIAQFVREWDNLI